ncbi:hypothetical protein WICPIJ_005455, partial [Wickerhamomyces pijperi]
MFSNKFVVEGKLAVITGGSQGLGFALAKKLVSKGANVVIISRTESKLTKCVAELKKRVEKENQFVDYIAADLSKYAECEKVREYFVAKQLYPDHLICCA